MKIILFTFSFFLLLYSANSFSQENTPNCYERYVKVFEIRKANKVKDGSYDNIIITIRKRGFADCFTGKVIVTEGVIERSSIEIGAGDNSFEPFYRSYKSDLPVSIKNGISTTLYTKDGELINILFVGAIKTE